MRKIALAASIGTLILVINACKKSDSNSTNPGARTVQNFSGSYKLTAITANILGLNVNLYDSLPACDRDNVIDLEPFFQYRYPLYCRHSQFYKVMGRYKPDVSQYGKHPGDTGTGSDDNDAGKKIIVNCQWLIVNEGQLTINH